MRGVWGLIVFLVCVGGIGVDAIVEPCSEICQGRIKVNSCQDQWFIKNIIVSKVQGVYIQYLGYD